MGVLLAITSGKGGVGKSTLSVGLGAALGNLGKKVLLVDMDEGLRCLDLMLGIDKQTVFDLSDIFKGKELEDAVYSCERFSGISLIPAPSRVGEIDASDLNKLCKKISDKYDFVIFDFPAGINAQLYKALPQGTLFLTVAVPDPVSIRDAAAMGNILKENNLKARLVINRFVYKECLKYNYKNIDQMIDGCNLQLLGIIPQSDELLWLSTKQKFKRNGRALASFMRMARRLNGESISLPKIKKI